MKRLTRLRILFAISAIILMAIATIWAAGSPANNGDKQTSATVTTNEGLCSVDPKSFMTTVNKWRKSEGVSPLKYSKALESGAKARTKDMIKNHYYGHVNPVTKAQPSATIVKYVPDATLVDEVLDGSNSASEAVSDFRDSPEHYDALVSPKYHYFGSYSVYHPEQWASYDNSGKQEAPAGTYSATCLVMGELADKVGGSSAQKSVSYKSKTSSGTAQLLAPTTSKSAKSNSTSQSSTYRTSCDGTRLAEVQANRDDLASEFASDHKSAISELNSKYPSGFASTAAYQLAIAKENQRYSTQSSQLQASYAAALEQINC